MTEYVIEADEMHMETCAFIAAVKDLNAQKSRMKPIEWSQKRLALNKEVKCNCK